MYIARKAFLCHVKSSAIFITFNVGKDFPLSFSLASLSTVDPFKSYFLCTCNLDAKWCPLKINTFLQSNARLRLLRSLLVSNLEVGAEYVSDHNQVGLNVVHCETEHGQVLVGKNIKTLTIFGQKNKGPNDT